jgi:hypothetical protein
MIYFAGAGQVQTHASGNKRAFAESSKYLRVRRRAGIYAGFAEARDKI